jgi:hypothetical protein
MKYIIQQSFSKKLGCHQSNVEHDPLADWLHLNTPHSRCLQSDHISSHFSMGKRARLLLALGSFCCGFGGGPDFH